MPTEPRTWEAIPSSNGEFVIVDDTDYDPESICTVHVAGPHAKYTAEENAKLIESLPGLVAAKANLLRALKLMIEHGERCNWFTRDDMVIVSKIKATIAESMETSTR